MNVLENMQNPDFNIIMCTEVICISVSMLYWKMKALIGITPNDIIKHLRLIKASELLNSKSCNVSEVAYQCGINDIT
jgi:transcriptional regulator GlxA family with amidase domain